MQKKIQGYTLHEQIGKGSSAQVFRATHCSKQGEFAIKIIENQLLIQNPKAEQCLLNEVKILSKIGICDHIVAFYQLIRSRNNHYFIYEYCNGGSLYDKMKKCRKMSQEEVLKYVKDILSAYRVLNREKVLHRDLKPENILFSNGKLKLADFGLCKGLQPEEYMTKTMLGSPIYMAPEVLKGESYTSKADIWSLGVITFQMLYGYCPYMSNSIAALASKIQTNPLQLPQKPIVSSQTKQILKKMLTRDHFRRIGWIQLFKEFFIGGEEIGMGSGIGTARSIKGQFDGNLSINGGNVIGSRRDNANRDNQSGSKSKDKSKSKNKLKSKKTSLCLIQYNSVPSSLPSTQNNSNLYPFLANIKQKEPKQQLKYNSPQKQNKINFNSHKYLSILAKNEQKDKEKQNRRLSNFSQQNLKNGNAIYMPTSTSSPLPSYSNPSNPIYQPVCSIPNLSMTQAPSYSTYGNSTTQKERERQRERDKYRSSFQNCNKNKQENYANYLYTGGSSGLSSQNGSSTNIPSYQNRGDYGGGYKNYADFKSNNYIPITIDRQDYLYSPITQQSQRQKLYTQSTKLPTPATHTHSLSAPLTQSLPLPTVPLPSSLPFSFPQYNESKSLFQKLQQIHKQFMDNSKVFEQVILRKQIQSLPKIIYFLSQIRNKLGNIKRELKENRGKIMSIRAKQRGNKGKAEGFEQVIEKEYQDLETMVQYEIIGIQGVIEEIKAIGPGKR